MPNVAQIFVEVCKTLQEFTDSLKQLVAVTVTDPIFTKLALGRQISVKTAIKNFMKFPHTV